MAIPEMEQSTLSRDAQLARWQRLTPRERDTGMLLAGGLSPLEIAAETGVSKALAQYRVRQARWAMGLRRATMERTRDELRAFLAEAKEWME